MNTYSITDSAGDIIEENLTVEQCAIALLTYDGYGYEIDKTEWGWELLISGGSRSGTGLGQYNGSTIPAKDPALSEDEATAQLFAEVVANADVWYPNLNVEAIGD